MGYVTTLRTLLADFDAGFYSERCVGFLFALYAIDYLEMPRVER